MRTPTSSVEPVRRIKRAAAALVLVIVVGTVGFTLIGDGKASLLDGLYMTAITLTSVGYGEVVDVSGSDGAKTFAVIIVLVGCGAFLYFFSSVTAFIVEGTLDRVFWQRRMVRMIGHLQGHVIICGGGTTGEHIARELKSTGRQFVVIEPDEERITDLYNAIGEFPSIAGDATDDEVLAEAGIGRARGLIACVSADKDNLVVTFSARNLNPDLRIIARSTDGRFDSKLRTAGADSVVSPTRIGGLRMVSEMIRPAVVSFLDVMLRDTERNLRVEEAVVARASAAEGMTVAALRERRLGNAQLLAIRDRDGHWEHNPSDDVAFAAGQTLIFIGGPHGREQMQNLAGRVSG